ncbi:MAG: hypothetical protein ACLFVJ_17970 [Persicimonas sp.]
MSVMIDHEAVSRQLAEIDREHEHLGDLRRRRTIQGLSVLGMLGSGARVLYGREYLSALPTARYLLEENERRWETTLEPNPESVDGGVAETSAHAAAIALTGIGGRRRADENPWVSVASAGFLAFRAVAAGRQIVRDLDEGRLDVFNAFNAVTSAAAVPLALPEAVRAVRGLFRKK